MRRVFDHQRPRLSTLPRSGIGDRHDRVGRGAGDPRLTPCPHGGSGGTLRSPRLPGLRGLFSDELADDRPWPAATWRRWFGRTMVQCRAEGPDEVCGSAGFSALLPYCRRFGALSDLVDADRGSSRTPRGTAGGPLSLPARRLPPVLWQSTVLVRADSPTSGPRGRQRRQRRPDCRKQLTERSTRAAAVASHPRSSLQGRAARGLRAQPAGRSPH